MDFTASRAALNAVELAHARARKNETARAVAGWMDETKSKKPGRDERGQRNKGQDGIAQTQTRLIGDAYSFDW